MSLSSCLSTKKGPRASISCYRRAAKQPLPLASLCPVDLSVQGHRSRKVPALPSMTFLCP